MVEVKRVMADIRREYGDTSLNEEETLMSPLLQFEQWFQDARIHEHDDPTAMVLSTVDAEGFPDARVVLLKGIEESQFIFYTNYHSVKGREIAANPHVALTFYWSKMARQVRVRGSITRVSDAMSDAYFETRPFMSRVSAIASYQSEEITSRQMLADKCDALAVQYLDKPIPRPEYWGGYAVTPLEVEFWQGRDNRLHDRIRYVFIADVWVRARLSP